jgi:hypothetical protein
MRIGIVIISTTVRQLLLFFQEVLYMLMATRKIRDTTSFTINYKQILLKFY